MWNYWLMQAMPSGTSLGVARITNAGYDFIDAVEKQERVRTKFLELFKAGIPYLMAVKAALEILKPTGG